MERLSIKQIRVGLDMTQKEMADFLNISELTYSRKEKGINEFYFSEIDKICKLANLSIDKVKV